jgi:hypothetical protein
VFALLMTTFYIDGRFMLTRAFFCLHWVTKMFMAMVPTLVTPPLRNLLYMPWCCTTCVARRVFAVPTTCPAWVWVTTRPSLNHLIVVGVLVVLTLTAIPIGPQLVYRQISERLV